MVVWNTRGCGNANFIRHLGEILRQQQPTVLLLLETKVYGPRGERACAATGFPKMHRIDGNGHSGGIWLFWNPDNIRIEIVHESPQALHAIAQVPFCSQPFLLSCIYASPIRTARLNLWNDMYELGNNLNLPWIMAGDFNEVLDQDEKWGGRPVSSNLT